MNSNSQAEANQTSLKLIEACKEIVIGRDDTIHYVVCAMLAGGHVLLEDYPGSGKTTLAKTLGSLIDCSGAKNHRQASDSPRPNLAAFKRVQFTPDLLPGDVLGVTVFEPDAGTFRFQPGPIFSHIVLADEINRTGPKVQSAFLESMAENQVTIDNQTYKLDDLFFVIGTQNPLDLAGTYPLPLVQLDRFLMKIPMSYVDPDSEAKILNNSDKIEKQLGAINPVVTREEILGARETCRGVHISNELLRAIVNLVQSTRQNPSLQFGASTRSAIMLRRATQAWALLQGRDYANEDDLKVMAPLVLKHRLKFNPGAGTETEQFDRLLAPHIEKLINQVSRVSMRG